MSCRGQRAGSRGGRTEVEIVDQHERVGDAGAERVGDAGADGVGDSSDASGSNTATTSFSDFTSSSPSPPWSYKGNPSTPEGYRELMAAYGAAGLDSQVEEIRRRVWLPLTSPPQV